MSPVPRWSAARPGLCPASSLSAVRHLTDWNTVCAAGDAQAALAVRGQLCGAEHGAHQSRVDATLAQRRTTGEGVSPDRRTGEQPLRLAEGMRYVQSLTLLCSDCWLFGSYVPYSLWLVGQGQLEVRKVCVEGMSSEPSGAPWLGRLVERCRWCRVLAARLTSRWCIVSAGVIGGLWSDLCV